MYAARAGLGALLKVQASYGVQATRIGLSWTGSRVSLVVASSSSAVGAKRFAHPSVIKELKEKRKLIAKGGEHRPNTRFTAPRSKAETRGAKGTIVPDFSAPPPPKRGFIVEVLSRHVTEFIKTRGRPLRISYWGLRGPAYKQLVGRLCPDDWRKEGSPANIMACLMERWATEALADLSQTSAQPLASLQHSLWDIDNVMLAYEAEGSRCFDRLCTQSYLLWLETLFVAQEEDGQELAHLRHLLSTVDLRHYPMRFPLARSMVRNIHLHVGPTNSGKTHGALIALCKANTGLYAGPLRLLAHEVWDRINTGKVSPGVEARPCNLTTGEEVRMVDEYAGLQACTVEMIGMGQVVDVAVIDEIQMIADENRGAAWTNAVVGVPAKELHLCGESSVVPLIKALAEACGDRVHVHEYERLTPLKLGKSLGSDLKKIQKGDCLVAFSRSEIFKLKRLIEENSPYRCAVAYGALPPETKAEQAKLFNDPDNDYSVMVASDAIGMGLNLKIKRVIFHSVTKWNGSQIVPISASQLKQIAGRAGRFGTSIDKEEGGFATTFDAVDLPILDAALKAPLLPIPRAGLQVPTETMVNFASLLPRKRKGALNMHAHNRPLSDLLEDLLLVCQIDSRFYFACSMDQQVSLAPILEQAVPTSMDLTLVEREKFAIAPANARDERLMALLANMVGYYLRGGLVSFEAADESLGMLDHLQYVEKMQKQVSKSSKAADINGESNASEDKPSGRPMDIESLMILESLHRGLNLYLWFSYRYPASFANRDHIVKIKLRAEQAIDYCLKAIQDQKNPEPAWQKRVASNRNRPVSGRDEQRSSLVKPERTVLSSGGDHDKRRFPARGPDRDQRTEHSGWRQTAKRSGPWERTNAKGSVSRQNERRL